MRLSAKEIGLVSVSENASLFFYFLGLTVSGTFLKEASGPGSEYGPLQWESSALTTAHGPSPLLTFVYFIV